MYLYYWVTLSLGTWFCSLLVEFEFSSMIRCRSAFHETLAEFISEAKRSFSTASCWLRLEARLASFSLTEDLVGKYQIITFN